MDYHQIRMMGRKEVICAMKNTINKTKDKTKKYDVFLRKYLNMVFSSWDRDFDKSYVIYFKLNNGICIEQKIFIADNNYLCYTNLALSFNTISTDEISELYRVMNKINTEIEYGNFEFYSGDLRFRTFYSPGEAIELELLDELIGYPYHIINYYGDEFRKIIKRRIVNKIEKYREKIASKYFLH